MKHHRASSITITQLRADAQGMAARFALANAKKKQDNIRAAWGSLQRLYRNAQLAIPLSNAFTLEGEPETWPNALRLAELIVAACDRIEPSA